jgi:hypothetical protein
MQRDIRFTSKVGEVDAGPSTRHEHAQGFLPDALQKSKIFIQAEILVIILSHVVRRGDHQMNTRPGRGSSLQMMPDDAVEVDPGTGFSKYV